MTQTDSRQEALVNDMTSKPNYGMAVEAKVDMDASKTGGQDPSYGASSDSHSNLADVCITANHRESHVDVIRKFSSSIMSQANNSMNSANIGTVARHPNASVSHCNGKAVANLAEWLADTSFTENTRRIPTRELIRAAARELVSIS